MSSLKNGPPWGWDRWQPSVPVFCLTICSAFQFLIIPSSTASDNDSLRHLFGDVVNDFPASKFAEIAALSRAEQLEFLRRRVLPADSTDICISVHYAPSELAFGIKNNDVAVPEILQVNHQILAPLTLWLELSDQHGKKQSAIVELERRLTYEQSPIVRLATETLIGLSNSDFEAAAQAIEKLEVLMLSASVSEHELDIGTFVLWEAAQISNLRETVYEVVLRVQMQLSVENELKDRAWHRYLVNLRFALRHELSGSPLLTAQGSSFWQPISRVTAATHGQGLPRAIWNQPAGMAENLIAHDQDYLLYRIPLQGNFRVEAETSTFAFRDIRLGYGGTWAGPAYDLKTILHGSFNGEPHTRLLDRPLDEIGKSMRVSLAVSDGVCRTLINGSEVHEVTVSKSDPWLSLFSFWYTSGWVRNLRILGSPTIPSTLRLLEDERLLGWNEFYGANTTAQHWKIIQDSDGSNVLHSLPVDAPTGSFAERLLQYHRPVLENGTITYRFFYVPGETMVHPALGTTAFLIRPSGIQQHRVTDGREESLLKRPFPVINSVAEASPSSVPLLPKEWNLMKVVFQNDDLVLVLNGQEVYRQASRAHHALPFGLFHYADQTQVRVRELTWKGEWPKQLPGWNEQELSDTATEQLLADADMPAHFSHRFGEGLPAIRFTSYGLSNTQQRNYGLVVQRDSQGKQQQSAIIPQIRLEGDFDIRARFSRFDARTESGGDANIHLLVQFEESKTDCCLYRKFTRYEKKELGQQIIQAAHFFDRNGHRAYNFPALTSEASAAGTLQLSRRGDQLHYLYTPDESTCFRHLHTETVPTGSTKAGGIRLISEAIKNGRVRSVWHSIEVRAQAISGAGAQTLTSVSDLNRTRRNLTAFHEFDFADAANRSRLQTWGRQSRFEQVDEGLRVTAPGYDDWEGHGVRLPFGLQGDFDVTLDLEVEHWVKPAQGGESVVLLQAEVRDSDATYVETKYAISDAGQTAGEFLYRKRNPDGQLEYIEVAQIACENVQQLRLVRRDGTAYFLVNPSTDEDSYVLLGQYKLGTLPIIPGDLRVLVHTGGRDRESRVLLKRLTVNAAGIIAVP